MSSTWAQLPGAAAQPRGAETALWLLCPRAEQSSKDTRSRQLHPAKDNHSLGIGGLCSHRVFVRRQFLKRKAVWSLPCLQSARWPLSHINTHVHTHVCFTSTWTYVYLFVWETIYLDTHKYSGFLCVNKKKGIPEKPNDTWKHDQMTFKVLLTRRHKGLC